VFEGLSIVGLGTFVLRYNATVCITEVGVTKCRWFDWVSDPFLNTFHDATYIRCAGVRARGQLVALMLTRRAAGRSVEDQPVAGPAGETFFVPLRIAVRDNGARSMEPRATAG
jgi:hypothetical protein